MARGRLSDTKALVARGLRGGDSSCPDHGRAVTARCAVPGVAQIAYGSEGLDIVYEAEPSVGPEGLRSAVMVANGGRVRGA